MSAKAKAIKSAAATIAAARFAGGKGEMSAQRKAMSKSKKFKVRKAGSY